MMWAMSIGDITRLIVQSREQNKDNLDEIYTLLYGEIKGIAHRHLRQLPKGQTISATVLANECYIKLAEQTTLLHENKRHFMNYLATCMRRFLIDQWRSKKAQKVAGIEGVTQVVGDGDVAFDVMQLEQLIDALRGVDEELADIFQQKVIFNFTFKELADIFNVSERHIIRKWNHIKTLLMTITQPSHADQ